MKILSVELENRHYIDNKEKYPSCIFLSKYLRLNKDSKDHKYRYLKSLIHDFQVCVKELKKQNIRDKMLINMIYDGVRNHFFDKIETGKNINRHEEVVLSHLKNYITTKLKVEFLKKNKK